MSWQKVNQGLGSRVFRERRSRPCVTRSEKRPNAAYMMLPKHMVPCNRVSIYSDAKGRIALEFGIDGDYVVRPTSRTSYTMKVTVPKPLVHLIPFGLHDTSMERSPEGWMILDTQALR